MASILPIKRNIVKKFESLIGKFLWKGAILRVSLDELKNKKLAGGLQLPCLATMGKALLTSQCVRLLKSENTRYISHIDYWLGPLLQNILPGMGQGGVLCAEMVRLLLCQLDYSLQPV